jgi:hypothetical protein
MMQKAQPHVLGFIREGQASGEVRSDIPAEQLSFILIGSLRMQVTRWRLSGFSFDLVKEGEKLWEALMPLVKM